MRYVAVSLLASSSITRRVYNLGLDEFFAWSGQEPRPGFTRVTVSSWPVALGPAALPPCRLSNVRITAVRKLAVEASDNGLLAPELANGITRVRGVKSKACVNAEVAKRGYKPMLVSGDDYLLFQRWWSRGLAGSHRSSADVEQPNTR